MGSIFQPPISLEVPLEREEGVEVGILTRKGTEVDLLPPKLT